MGYSKNERAEKVVGLRPKGCPVYLPWEMGLYCPVCNTVKRGEINETLDWSEYNTFVYCHNCNVDIPSIYCKEGIEITGKNKDFKIKILTDCYLDVVEIVKEREK